jgi:beta-glucosidase
MTRSRPVRKAARPLYLDPRAEHSARVDDLISCLTVNEKIGQLMHASPAIPRLGISAYNWWSECLHGVARAGRATVFPQAIGMAASWNVPLMHRVASAISDEARAKHHDALRKDNHGPYMGLTYCSPNINIFRDPRWGRGQETYGEDPYLTSRMGVAFVRGLQGDDPRCLKLVAIPKHYAVHSGPEKERHGFNACPDARTLHETYLRAFEACMKEGRAASIMGAYNRVLGEPCCASVLLLQTILREQWGFDGCVVSDLGANDDIHQHHKVTADAAESAALSVRNGCDLNFGETYKALPQALERGLVTEAEIDGALRRVMAARFRLGMFDPPARVPYARISPRVVDGPEHRALALSMARESIVLLKNEGGLLPLRNSYKSILLTGPAIDSPDVLLANYNGHSSKMVLPLEGILAKVDAGTSVNCVRMCEFSGSAVVSPGAIQWNAAGTDLIIAVMGLSPRLEGEEGAAEESEAGGDRRHIGLPHVQEEFLKALHATGIPVVLVLTGGSPLAIPWAVEHIPAIVMAWYPGEEGGTAIADVLFGAANPAGRLPVTVVRSAEQLPPFDDYRMEGRTYRFLREDPLFPFGFGLSYTTFAYSALKLSAKRIAAGQSMKVGVTVRNTGRCAGDEVVQLYVTDVKASVPVALRHLEGFARVHLKPGQKKVVTFTLTPDQMAIFDDAGRRVLEPGEFEISVGGCQPGWERLGAATCLSAKFEVTQK